jgi:hypothetical protein
MIDFFGPGFDVAERMGLLPVLAKIHRLLDRLLFVDERGRPGADLPYARLRRLIFPSCTETSAMPRSRRRPVIKAEKAAESLPPDDRTVGVGRWRSLDQPVLKSLMVSLWA